MHYYQFNIADYRKDTAHLSLLEHGVYRQLLDWYYISEEPIPKETQVVFRRLCARTQEEQTATHTPVTNANDWILFCLASCMSYVVLRIAFFIRVTSYRATLAHRLKMLSCSLFKLRNDSLGLSWSVNKPL